MSDNFLVMEENDYKKFSIFMEMERFDDAVDICFEAIKKNENDESAYANLAVPLLNQRKFDEALDALETCLSLDPDHAIAYRTLAYIQHLLKDYQSAYDSICIAVEIDPEVAEYHTSLGFRHQALGEFEKSISVFKGALELDPEDMNAWRGLMHAYLEIDDYDKHVSTCFEALEICPDDAWLLNNAGVLYWEQGDHIKATEIFSDLLRDDAENKTYRSNLISCMNAFYVHKPFFYNRNNKDFPEHIQSFYNENFTLLTKFAIVFHKVFYRFMHK